MKDIAVLLRNYLVEFVDVNEEAVDMVAGINGMSEETMNDVLYYVTGYHDYEQCADDYGHTPELDEYYNI